MKYLKLICLILLPILMFAQAERVPARGAFIEKYDEESYREEEGCILWISGDSINFEETWMHLAPTGADITSKTGTLLSLTKMRAPFWAAIGYFVGPPRLIKSLHILKQFEYDREGGIIGYYKKEELMY